MPTGKGHNSRGKQTKVSRPVVPTFCLTLPDGLSLTSVVLEGIGSNGRLLAGPTALPWKHKKSGGTGHAQSTASGRRSKPQNDNYFLSPEELNTQKTEDKASKSLSDVKDDLSLDTVISPNRMCAMTSRLNIGGFSYKGLTPSGSLWAKVRGIGISSQREMTARKRQPATSVFSVLSAFRPRRGRLYGMSRLGLPLAGSKHLVCFSQLFVAMRFS
ncbi:hypothetical protein ElyMa_006788000 [Elysia marginata]|uniref:Uncharacterized protein n=1 Tax=Elysia marginata TaxID=1093978 RepID=A0AAV4J098_9GAST|nr:hypothetical protein ElyMa_006788000 [Elysia marginata]